MLIGGRSHSDGGPDSAAQVAEALTGPGGQRAELPLLDVVDEVAEWAQSARLSAWRTPVNHQSLQLDVDASRAGIGPALSTLIHTALDSLVSRFRSGATKNATERDRLFVVEAADQLRTVLRSQAALSAAFDDVVFGTAENSILLRQLVDNFRCLLPINGFDIRLATSSLSAVLRGDSSQIRTMRADFRAFEADVPPEPLTADERFALVANYLRAAPKIGQCIVWLAYQPGFLPGFSLEAGPVTFLMANWHIPNARNDDGQLFPLRDELRGILNQWLFEEIDVNDPESYAILARVDLGVRSTTGAIEEAEAVVSTFLDLAVNASGGVRWSRSGGAVVLVDGNPRISAVVAADSPPPSNDYHGMNITADALAETAPRVGAALARAPMPTHLREAIKLQTEARLTTAGAYILIRNKAISDRTVVALQDRATESLATHSGVKPLELANWAADRWAYESWHRDVFHIVNSALTSPNTDHAARRNLEHKVSSVPDGHRRISLARVIEHKAELLAFLAAGPNRDTTETLLRSVEDPVSYLKLRENYLQAARLLQSRARRVRNAVVHGNPLTAAVLESIKEYSAFVCDASIAIGLRSYVDDTATSELIREYENETKASLTRLRQGESWLQIWKSYSSR